MPREMCQCGQAAKWTLSAAIKRNGSAEELGQIHVCGSLCAIKEFPRLGIEAAGTLARKEVGGGLRKLTALIEG